MKKIIALLLSVIMAFSVLAVTAAAADATPTTYAKSATYSTSNDIEAGKTYKIPEGITMTVPSDITLYIPAGSTLLVEDGGVLNVLGTVVVLANGTLDVEGTILHGTNVSTENGTNAKATADVYFPAVAKYISDALEADAFGVTVNVTYQYDATGATKTANVTEGSTVKAQLGTVMNIKAAITEPDPENPIYDSKYFTVYEAGVAISNVNGVCPLTITGTHTISYINAQTKSEFYRDCKIYLPTGSGYAVTGRNGEMSDDGTVYVKYGTTFSFTLDLDSSYDRSNVTVNAYNGYGYLNITGTDDTQMANMEPLTPDSEGYYSVLVDGDKTILVEGVVSNDTLSTATGIMDTVKYILNMITSFLKRIAELLGFKTA